MGAKYSAFLLPGDGTGREAWDVAVADRDWNVRWSGGRLLVPVLAADAGDGENGFEGDVGRKPGLEGFVMKEWLRYAVVGLLVVMALAAALWFIVDPDQRRAVLFGAVVAYVIQLAAFGALLRFHGDAQFFVFGWAAGIGLRFLTVGVVAFVVSRTEVLPLDATLLSLVGFIVLLLFIEPMFLRRGPATK
jgi:hypothetical protein